MHDQDQGEEGEGAGGDADDRAAQELADFLGDLRLGELDLLADQRRGAFGDVEDELGDRSVVGAGGAEGSAVGSASLDPLLRRILVEEPAAEDPGGPRGDDAGQRAARRRACRSRRVV